MPHIHGRHALWLALAWLWPATLPAQHQDEARIWRCGSEYSHQPCGGGIALRPAPAANAADRTTAEEATRRIRAQADALTRERERREAAAAAQPPVFIARHPGARSEGEDDDRALAHPKRPQRSKGRNPQAGHFTARGAAAR